MYILPKFFDPTLMPKFTGRPVPKWLGDFTFEIRGKAYGRSFSALDIKLQKLHEDITRAAELTFPFTTWFLQRYDTGTQVLRHRDPRNNIHATYIAVYGDFEGGITTIWDPDEKQYQLKAGDVGILRCTKNGIQGPYHSVSRITKGTRYTFIGNCII